MNRLFFIAITLLLAAACLTGITAAQETREFTDDLGRTLTLPAEIDTVSPSGPLAQIVLYSMNPDLFVSVASKLTDLELQYLDNRLASLPVTGQFYGSKSTMNAEEIMELNKKLNIDVVLDVGSVKSGMLEDLNTIQSKTDVSFAFITQDKLADIAPSYLRLGQLLGMEEQGKNLSSYAENLLADFDAGMKRVGSDKVSLLYVTRTDGNSVSLIGSGEKSYHGEIVNYLGTNLAPASVSSGGLGDTYSMEDILRLDPDYIIVAWDEDHTYYKAIQNSAVWQTMRAVKNGNVYEAPAGPYPWMGNPPSVNKLLSLIWLGNLFYPDVFSYDLQTKVTEFYDLFYHHSLTETEFADLTANAGKNTAVPTAAPTKTPAPLFGLLAGFAAAILLLRKI